VIASNGESTARTALVTGASAGIGEALAHVFAERGWNLIVTARRTDRLLALADTIEQRHGRRVHVVAADLASPAAGAMIEADVARAGLRVDALVNNAGYAVSKTYRRSTWNQQQDFIQVMITAVAELTHRFLPGMVERRYGRILNVASIAGLLPGAGSGHTLYGASKAFVIRFSQSLAVETHKHGVHVTAVCPGFTYSEFHDVTGTRQHVSGMPRFMWMEASTVARQAYEASMAGRVVYVNGAINKALTLLGRLLPERVAVAAAIRWVDRRRDR
jgi:short-subunit dehydrogenase